MNVFWSIWKIVVIELLISLCYLTFIYIMPHLNWRDSNKLLFNWYLTYIMINLGLFWSFEMDSRHKQHIRHSKGKTETNMLSMIAMKYQLQYKLKIKTCVSGLRASLLHGMKRWKHSCSSIQLGCKKPTNVFALVQSALSLCGRILKL